MWNAPNTRITIIYHVNWKLLLTLKFVCFVLSLKHIWPLFSPFFIIKSLTNCEITYRSAPSFQLNTVFQCIDECMKNVISLYWRWFVLTIGSDDGQKRQKEFFKAELTRLQRSLKDESSKIHKPKQWVSPRPWNDLSLPTTLCICHWM